ncbi:hypothetical protein AG1IA_03179 [Rhizoctonia solani AG-1 IA]|uniref:Uncharacterized protein n=1 Tax=Thanatephorus cucumeris (strain AG1-IA) TaxID=983506 RepID=L8X2G0_THACA|nr:hypothetical protein AG1IA_03179 [Rhizoctonia solani AG-1 IA]
MMDSSYSYLDDSNSSLFCDHEGYSTYRGMLYNSVIICDYVSLTTVIKGKG